MNTLLSLLIVLVISLSLGYNKKAGFLTEAANKVESVVVSIVKFEGLITVFANKQRVKLIQ